MSLALPLDAQLQLTPADLLAFVAKAEERGMALTDPFALQLGDDSKLRYLVIPNPEMAEDDRPNLRAKDSAAPAKSAARRTSSRAPRQAKPSPKPSPAAEPEPDSQPLFRSPTDPGSGSGGATTTRVTTPRKRAAKKKKEQAA